MDDTSSWPWSRVVAAAETQFAVLSLDQLCAINGEIRATKQQVRRWVRDGRVVKVAPRVWRVAGAPVTWHQRLLAGLLSLGSDACVSHESAAQLHGFDRTPADRVQFTVARPRRQVRLEETVHTTRYWPRTDRITIDRFHATSATRTIIDLARARAPELRLQAAISLQYAQGHRRHWSSNGVCRSCAVRDAGDAACSTVFCLTPADTPCSSDGSSN